VEGLYRVSGRKAEEKGTIREKEYGRKDPDQ
jgi:hypothetical protein